MSNHQPEHGPEVTAYLEEHPLIKKLVAGYAGMEAQSVDYSIRGKKFSVKLARIVMQEIFSTSADDLSLNGVKNWADFYWYIAHRAEFHLNYFGAGLVEEIKGYREARYQDELAAERKARSSRKRKP